MMNQRGGGGMRGGGGGVGDHSRKRGFPGDNSGGYTGMDDTYYDNTQDPYYRSMEPPPPSFLRQENSSMNYGSTGTSYSNQDYTKIASIWDDNNDYSMQSSGGSMNQSYDQGYNQNMYNQTSYGNNYSGDNSQFQGGNYGVDFSEDVPVNNTSGVYSTGSQWASNQKQQTGRGGGPSGNRGRGGNRGGRGGTGGTGVRGGSGGGNRGVSGRGGNRGAGGRGGGGGFGGGGGGGNRGGGGGNRGGGQQFNTGRGQFQGKKKAVQKPGLPPTKAFNQPGRGGRGRGARGNKNQGGVVAPVHSLAKITNTDTSQLSLPERLRRFCLFIQNDTPRINAIQSIENGLTGSKLGFKTDYMVEELLKVSNRWLYTGCLHLSGVFIARSVGPNKKEVKHDTYQKALDILRTKTVAEIFSLRDPGIESLRQEMSLTMNVDQNTPAKNEPAETGNQSILPLTKQDLRNFGSGVVTVRDGFLRLVKYLTEWETLPLSRISCIEQAVSASHCTLSHSYDVQSVRLPTGKFFFRGTLTIADIIIATGKGYKKKEAKVDTYENALESLTSKSIEELMKGVFVETPEPTTAGHNMPVMVDKDKQNQPILKRLEEMIQTIKDSQFKENNINTMDVTAIHIGFTPTCIYRKIEGEDQKGIFSCELYLDNILIASGESPKRKESQSEAYNNAWDILCTSTAEYILKEHKKLTPEESSDPSVIDVWVKGSGKPNGDSNMAGLKRYQFDPNDKSKTVETAVILEHDDWTIDRKRQAFCILSYSATLNGMLLQWNTEPEGTLFKCTITLQNQVVGDAIALAKNTARNLAAASALFHLYESQDVIKISKRDDSKLWIPYEDIVERAKMMKEQSGEVDTVEEEKPKKETEDMTPATAASSQSPTPPADKWVVQVGETIINEYLKKFTLEELMFGPGLPLSESKEIRMIAKGLNLKNDIRQHNGQSYLVICKKWTPQEMVKCLKQSAGVSGKYSIVQRYQLPKHADIELDIQRQDQAISITKNTSQAKPKLRMSQEITI